MITHYDFHALCLIFPQCSDDELQMLVADIRENGLKTPITLFGEKILDGRNRYLACRMLNKEPDYVKFTGNDPLSFVISQNLCRRHLSESQRAMVAADVLKLYRQEQERQKKVTVVEVAQQLNVSERLVHHAIKIVHEGTEQDVKDIMSGAKKVRPVAAEVKEARDFSLTSAPPKVNPKAELMKTQRDSILAKARNLRKNMDEMFALTQWNPMYKALHRNLRKIIFDE